MWQIYALLSAFFASLTAIFAKLGMKNVDSNLATAIRTVIILVMAWLIVFIQGSYKGIPQLTKTNYLFLVLSGLATGVSWLFYFRAISIGDVSKVAPIDKFSIVFTTILAFLILHETISIKTIGAIGFITIGTFMLLK